MRKENYRKRLKPNNYLGYSPFALPLSLSGLIVIIIAVGIIISDVNIININKNIYEFLLVYLSFRRCRPPLQHSLSTTAIPYFW